MITSRIKIKEDRTSKQTEKKLDSDIIKANKLEECKFNKNILRINIK